MSGADGVILPDPDTLLTVHEALAKLAAEDPAARAALPRPSKYLRAYHPS